MIACYIASLFISGCQKNTVPPQLKSDFSAVITAESRAADPEGYLLQAEIFVEDGTNVEINIITPEETEGLTYIWNQGFEMIYNELHCKTESDYLPDFSFAQAVYNVLKCACESRDVRYDSELKVFKGKCKSGEFEIYADSQGYIQNISVPEINLSVNFEYN